MSDTFSAGVNPGGLYTISDIKSLIGYILCTVEEPVPRETLLTVLTENHIANYFDCCTALDELLRAENYEDTPDGLVLTETGREVVQMLGTRVRFGLREQATSAALSMLARRRRERENTVRIEPLSRGCTVTCETEEAGAPFFSLTLRVADTLQAELIRERFLSDPPALYQAVLAALLQSPESAEE